MSRDPSRIFVGGLPEDIRSKELRDIFNKYGEIQTIDIKCSSKGSAFAFVAFDDTRDAEDAIRGRDGYRFAGHPIRVERSGEPRSSRRVTSGPPLRSEYRVRVKGLPPSASWQDLKDHMRQAGPVGYAAIRDDGTGVVEFERADDMKYALKRLNGITFKNPFHKCTITIKPDHGVVVSTSRSRSRHRHRSNSRSHSPHDRKRSRRQSSSSSVDSKKNDTQKRSGSRTDSREKSSKHSDRDAKRNRDNSETHKDKDDSEKRRKHDSPDSRSRSASPKKRSESFKKETKETKKRSPSPSPKKTEDK
eukprot:Platyproteum_vivax@DN2230_c0_g1_i1.p1